MQQRPVSKSCLDVMNLPGEIQSIQKCRVHALASFGLNVS
jgi:hypothetical protein